MFEMLQTFNLLSLILPTKKISQLKVIVINPQKCHVIKILVACRINIIATIFHRCWVIDHGHYKHQSWRSPANCITSSQTSCQKRLEIWTREGQQVKRVVCLLGELQVTIPEISTTTKHQRKSWNRRFYRADQSQPLRSTSLRSVQHRASNLLRGDTVGSLDSTQKHKSSFGCSFEQEMYSKGKSLQLLNTQIIKCHC